MTLDLTIAIPAKNEAANLPGCLDSIGQDFAAEVVLIDSASTDATCRIARDRGVRVIPFAWDGQFPKKRNWFLRNHPPQSSWVLFLDADEYLTPDFKRELRATLPATKHSGFWLKYSIYFLGGELRHGYPLEKLALFRVGAGEYEQIDEQAWSSLDMEIHEHPQIEGSIGRISNKIDHRDFRGVHHYVAKHNEYSSWEAKRFLQQQLRSDDHQLTWRQRTKYAIVQSPVAGIVYFFGAYIMMGGFLDGARGFVFALLKMSYFTQVYCKIRELRSEP